MTGEDDEVVIVISGDTVNIERIPCLLLNMIKCTSLSKKIMKAGNTNKNVSKLAKMLMEIHHSINTLIEMHSNI
jgi:hypothetical protein